MKKSAIKRKHEENSRFSQLLFDKSEKLVKNLQAQIQSDDVLELNKKPAWIDDDDVNYAANIIPSVKTEALYADKLKQKFETLMGTPKWAKIDTKSELKKDDSLLRKVGHIHKQASGFKSTNLDFVRVSRINHVTKNEGPYINCVEFHPKSTVALVAGQSGVISLFSVGSDTNEKIHSFKLKNWNISTATFTPNGNEAYISSCKTDSFCAYDLIRAEPTLVPFPKDVKKALGFKLSPDGKFIAISDKYDEVFILSAASREMLKILKHSSNVKSITFSPDSKQLYSFGCAGEVTIWDLKTYKSVQKFYDSGCVNASCIAVSNCGRLLATGSQEGIVNIYETKNLNSPEPIPIKIISNLKTRITTLTFNPTTQLLGMASNACPDAAKMVHIPSYNVFQNFPTHNRTLHSVAVMSFSPNSGYLGIGNNMHQASLFRLKYFKNY